MFLLENVRFFQVSWTQILELSVFVCFRRVFTLKDDQDALALRHQELDVQKDKQAEMKKTQDERERVWNEKDKALKKRER